MSDDVSFLEEEEGVSSTAILRDVADKARHLLELKWDMDEKEEAYLEAKKLYDEFRCTTLPTYMEMTGLESIVTAGGAKVEVVSKYYCSPNKNEKDLDTMEKFLSSHGMQTLVNKEVVTPETTIPLLEEAGIPFTVVRAINTNSLKAWLKDQIGANGGKQQFGIQDIPDCMHFVQIKECEIS